MKEKGIVTGICIVDALLLAAGVTLYVRQDRTAPVISFLDNEVRYEEGMDPSLLLEGVSAVDDRDGDVSDTLLVEKVSNTSRGEVIVTYAAMDSVNNVAKASRVLKTAKGQAAGMETKTDSEEGKEEDSGPAQPGNGENPEGEDGDGNENPQDGDGNENLQDEDGNENPQNGDGNENPQNGGGNENPQDRDENENPQDRDEANARPQEDGRGVAGVRENGADNAGQDAPAVGGGEENQPNEGRQNQAPVLQLASGSLTVGAGSPGVDWTQCIGQLEDDRDSYAQLYASLVMEGHVDLNTPGEYPVTLYTRDSEGAESVRQPLVVRVE